MSTTNYDVSLRYLLEDRVTGGARNMDAGLRATAASASSLTSVLGRLGAVAGGLFGLREAKKVLVDYNADMENAVNTTAGLMQLNVGGNWIDNIARATSLVGRLQQEAKTSIGTTKDMVSMLSMITQPLTAAGASMDDLVNMTKGAVVASRAFGISADVAARDVDQAIRGQFHVVDQFSTKILGPMGFVGEAGRAKFNALSQEERMRTYARGLQQPAIKDMAKAQGESFSGVLSTLQDNIEIGIGKIGLPLFKEITAEIKRWNEWSDKNSEAIGRFGESLSRNLMTAFTALKGTASFFWEHRETLLQLAKTWAALKLTSMATGGIGDVLGGLRSLGAATRSLGDDMGKANGATAALGGLGANALSTAASLATLGVAAYQLGTWIGNFIADESTRTQTAVAAGSFTGPQALRDYQKLLGERSATGSEDPMSAWDSNRHMVSILKKSGLAGANGLDREQFATMLRSDPELMSSYAATLGLNKPHEKRWWEAAGHVPSGTLERDPNVIAEAFGKAIDPLLREFQDGMQKIPDLPKKPTSAEKPKVNVTIQRIEVASDDPDRFVIGLTNAFRRVVANPGQARRVLREGW